MNKSKIEWCDYTWNPVTGCEHCCEYCYARQQIKRFEGYMPRGGTANITWCSQDIAVLNEPLMICSKGIWRKAPWPFGFKPTFHRYRLDEPRHTKKPQNIFVCSMADLFGEWVPDEWIWDVFEACEAAQWHRYIFLTKNPDRYGKTFHSSFDFVRFHKNTLWGATATDTVGFNDSGEKLLIHKINTGAKIFMSIEPLLESINARYLHNVKYLDWLIIGAENSRRKNKIVPEREWIKNIVEQCKEVNIPVFMKNSLAGIWGDPLIQEYPWEVFQ